MLITFPLAALTLMLWIIWSDSIRSRRPTPIIYWFRVVLFLGASGALLYNLVRWRPWIGWGTGSLFIVAALAGFVGAAYFLRKALTSRGPLDQLRP